MSLAEAIRTEIDRRAISQDEVAETIGVRQQTVSRWATGELLPAPQYLPSLAKFLHLPVTEVREMRANGRRSRDVASRLDEIERRLSQIERHLRGDR